MPQQFTAPEPEREQVRAWIESHVGPSEESDEPLYPHGMKSYAQQADVHISTLRRALGGLPIRERSWQKIASEFYVWTEQDELIKAIAQIRGVSEEVVRQGWEN